jgi:type III secretory pathway component EscU
MRSVCWLHCTVVNARENVDLASGDVAVSRTVRCLWSVNYVFELKKKLFCFAIVSYVWELIILIPVEFISLWMCKCSTLGVI